MAFSPELWHCVCVSVESCLEPHMLSASSCRHSFMEFLYSRWSSLLKLSPPATLREGLPLNRSFFLLFPQSQCLLLAPQKNSTITVQFGYKGSLTGKHEKVLGDVFDKMHSLSLNVLQLQVQVENFTILLSSPFNVETFPACSSPYFQKEPFLPTPVKRDGSPW